MVVLLTSASPRVSVSNLILPPKPHQEAIIKACLDVEDSIYTALIEKKKDIEPFGVLAAPVGCGKTLCVLSMVLLDKQQIKKNSWWGKFKVIFTDDLNTITGATLVVVPSHLYEQWDSAIAKFVEKGKLKVHKFRDYADVSKLYREDAEESMIGSDLFLVSSLYYQTVASLLLEIKVTFRRLVFDEADSLSNLIRYASPAIVTWFVSASIGSIFDSRGLTIGSNGTYKVTKKTLEKATVDVDLDFVRESWKLPEVAYKTVTIDDARDKAVSEMVRRCDKDLFESICACDWRRVVEVELAGRRIKIPENECQLLCELEKGWKEMVQDCEKEKERVELMEDERIRADVIEREEAKLDMLVPKLRGLKIDNFDGPFFKISRVVELCQNSPKKTIVFSSVFQAINEIDERFKRLNIKFIDLDGGSEALMARALVDFNTGNSKILLCHSAMFSCGANLEAAERIIFMHSVPKSMREQVIGRAQRPGRLESLEVVELKYGVERF